MHKQHSEPVSEHEQLAGDLRFNSSHFRSKLKKEIAYRLILKIILKQIFDFSSSSYKSGLSEELKIAIFDCIEVASRQLDYDVVEVFMVEDNKILLSQWIYVCKEAISKEKYLKIR